MSRPTQDTANLSDVFVYRTFTFCDASFQTTSTSHLTRMAQSFYPIAAKTALVRAFPLSIATTQGITVVLFSSGY